MIFVVVDMLLLLLLLSLLLYLVGVDADGFFLVCGGDVAGVGVSTGDNYCVGETPKGSCCFVLLVYLYGRHEFLLLFLH